jgi:branched-chain amino acid transport system permease protein
MKRYLTLQNILVAVLILGLALIPSLAGRYVVYVSTEILIYALFAISLNLLLGYGGMISFGHAAYFGIGAYTVAVLGTTYKLPFALSFLGSLVMGALAALIIGYFCVRLKSIFLAMLTLAFGQFVWAIAFQWRTVTGGDTGFIGMRSPEMLSSYTSYYYFVLAVVVVSAFVIYRITRSTFGRILVSTRENEMRVEFVGVNVKRIQLIAFVISGAFSSIAGALFALFNGSVFPEYAWWTNSSEVLIMSILGGIHAFLGPAIGAAVIIFLDQQITEYTQYWPTVLGIILLIVLFLFPEGITGMADRVRRRFSVGRGN